MNSSIKNKCIFTLSVISSLTYSHDHRIDSVKVFWATQLHKLKKVCTRAEAKKDEWYAKPEVVERSAQPRITWIGHATFLIQMNGINILTDPVFFDLSFFYKRITRPGVPLQSLPKIDVIVISHNHRDHMDEKSLKWLLKQHNPTVLVPKGLRPWFVKRGFTCVVEREWGEHHLHTHDLTFTFLPVEHWSSRTFLDYQKSLCGSWLIKNGKQAIYFAGDTAMGNHFSQIGKKYNIDVAILPIGPNEPETLSRTSHMCTEQACQAFLDLKAKVMVPMHWGTFMLATDCFADPINRLRAWWDERKPRSKILKIFRFGESVCF